MIACSLVCGGISPPHAPAQQAAEPNVSQLDRLDDEALAAQIQAALAQGKYSAAQKRAKQLAGRIDETTGNDRLVLQAGDLLLRCGLVEQATELFDMYVKRHPDSKPYLWQRGIALYFDDQFERGADQFEIHRTVNPNDVENAAWHFLCVAKRDSPETARSLLLPAPGDPREPMEAVLTMFREGRPQTVKDRLAQLGGDGAVAKSAHFYGQLYLGLYADAMGDRDAARQHLEQAVKDAPPHYMGDVARVYARHLKQPSGEDATEAN
jgi:lipoprotein NlpI